MEKRTLDQAKELVNSSFPTIFSKDDVINLLESIEILESIEEKPKEKFSLSQRQIESIARKIASEVEDDPDRVIESDDVEFDVDVNSDLRINIEISGGLRIDSSEIESIAKNVIEEFIDDLNSEEE
jgi:hypothetical protein